MIHGKMHSCGEQACKMSSKIAVYENPRKKGKAGGDGDEYARLLGRDSERERKLDWEGVVYGDCGESAQGCVRKESVGKPHFETNPETKAARGWRSAAASYSGV